MTQITDKLTLVAVEENNWDNEKLIAVLCIFSFYGEDCEAYVVIDKLDAEYPNYAMTEAPESISDSFNAQLEDEENWKKIVECVKKYNDEWIAENIEDDLPKFKHDDPITKNP